MSLLIGDDYPEGVGPQDREKQEPAGALRRRPAPGEKRHDWPRWRGSRPRSMLIEDAPDPAEDDARVAYDAGDEYAGHEYADGPPYPGNGFLLDPGPGPDGYQPDHSSYDGYPGDRITGDRYPVSGNAVFPDSGPATVSYADPGYADPRYSPPGYANAGPDYPRSGYPDPGFADPRYPGPGYPGSGHPGHAYTEASDRYIEPIDRYAGPGDRGRWNLAESDRFRPPPDQDDYQWGGDAPGPEEEPSVRHPPFQEVAFLRRESRDRDEGGSPRMFVTNAQRLGGVLLAAASVIGVALYVPSILAANSRSFVGVVSSGIASLNFRAAGRVGSVRVHLGQVVRTGEVLATEAGVAAGARAAAVQADRAAITADKAKLATLRADGSAAASMTGAQHQLAKDRRHRRADQKKLAATEIVAPGTGTVVAINGQPGETVSRAGLRGSAAHGKQPRFSLLPSGPRAGVPPTVTALPVIAVRTGSGWQVRLLIPQTDTSVVKAGGHVTISVPAAQLSGVKGTVIGLSPTPVINAGGTAYEAVVQVLGRSGVTPLSGMTANVQLGSLQLRGRAAPVTGRPAAAHRAGVAGTG